MANHDLNDRLAHVRPQRTVLSDEVYEAVKAIVMDHIIAPGERLSIERLSRELEVSPTPVREALARLEAEHLVVKEPLKGYRSTQLLSKTQTIELFELRMLIEPWTAARAARSLTPDQRALLIAELDGTIDAPDSEQYIEYRSFTAHDERFHGLIMAVAKNQRVVEVLKSLHIHLHLFRLRYRQDFGVSTIEEHQRIGSAILAGDADAAEAAMGAHLEASLSRLLPGFDDAGNIIATELSDEDTPTTDHT